MRAVNDSLARAAAASNAAAQAIKVYGESTSSTPVDGMFYLGLTTGSLRVYQDGEWREVVTRWPRRRTRLARMVRRWDRRANRLPARVLAGWGIAAVAVFDVAVCVAAVR